MDGTLGSQTAWMLDGSGVVITSGEELAEIIRAGARAGWPVGVHAIGDRANREALDAFESTRRTGCSACDSASSTPSAGAGGRGSLRSDRHRMLRPVQPRTVGSRSRRALLADKADGAYAFRSLWDSGALVANGSDAPVEDFDPLAGIRAGVLRTIDERPAWYLEQSGTIEEALLASTVNPAWLSGDERRRGKLSPATSPISSSSRAIHSNARPTSSSPSEPWRRWSVDAGFTTHLPGPSRAADRPQGGAATLRRRSDCIRVGQAGACGAGLRAARRAVRPPSRHERPRDRPGDRTGDSPAARPRGEPARRPGARSSVLAGYLRRSFGELVEVREVALEDAGARHGRLRSRRRRVVVPPGRGDPWAGERRVGVRPDGWWAMVDLSVCPVSRTRLSRDAPLLDGLDASPSSGKEGKAGAACPRHRGLVRRA